MSSKWIIQDHGSEGLSPMCDLRATFEQRTGGLTTLERLTGKMGCLPSGFTCEDAARAAMITARTGLIHLTEGTATEVDQPCIEKPWDILDNLPKLLAGDLEEAPELETPKSGSVVGDGRVDVDTTVTIFPGVVFDATAGSIRIEEGATIRPNAVICGPCWIGKGTTIIDGAQIKANTSIGPHCKVGGEVGSTIIQGNTNKSHQGHLGDSVIGEWVNFGAGTSNSNLLNTYGDVIITDLEGNRHRTNRQFVGCFVGDHVKFAIETRIMTGTICGTGAMIASTQPPPTTTPRFTWHTDSGTKRFRIEKFLDIAKIVMARRGCELEPATEVMLRKLAE